MKSKSVSLLLSWGWVGGWVGVVVEIIRIKAVLSPTGLELELSLAIKSFIGRVLHGGNSHFMGSGPPLSLTVWSV